MRGKNNFFYTLVTFVVIVFFWIGFFLIPKLSELEDLNDEAEQYKVKLTVMLDDIKKSEKLEKNVLELNDEVLKMHKRLIDNASLNNIVDLMHTEFNKYNVSIVQISPVFNSYLALEKNNENEFFNRLPIELKLKAKFIDFVRLLENCENMAFTMKPDQILIKSNNSSTLLMDLNVSVYVSSGKRL